jgi:regulator of protease activity HflC (stomatin/prohibitin superfamily)
MRTSTLRKRLAIAAGAAAIFLASLSWYTVQQGYRAVILRNGALIGIAEPGLGFKLPVIDAILPISVQENVRVYGSGDKVFESYSSDLTCPIFCTRRNERLLHE